MNLVKRIEICTTVGEQQIEDIIEEKLLEHLISVPRLLSHPVYQKINASEITNRHWTEKERLAKPRVTKEY